jgi:hypothetical protein
MEVVRLRATGEGKMTTTNGTGTPRPSTHAARQPQQPPANTGSPRLPRRIVLLADGEDSAVAEVLREYSGAEVSGKRIHADLQRFAAEHRGRQVAAEWLGTLGWTRFLWCRK